MLMSRFEMKANPTTIPATRRLSHTRGLSLHTETNSVKIIPMTVYRRPIGCMVTRRIAPMTIAKGASPRLEIILAHIIEPIAIARFEGTTRCRPVSGNTVKASSVRATPAAAGPQ